MSSMLAWVLFDSGVKAAVVLAIAFVATWARRRASAAIRERIWTLAFCGANVLPAISSIVPQWRIPIAGMVLPTSTGSRVKTIDETSSEANLPRVSSPIRHQIETNNEVVNISESASVANADVVASDVEAPRHSGQSGLAKTPQAGSRFATVFGYDSTILIRVVTSLCG
jgi:hypothetical protein